MKNTIRRKPYLIPLFIIIGVVAVAIFGGVVMYLWNETLVPATGAKLISFWQALGLLVLSRLLVGGFGGRDKSRRRDRKWRESCADMTPEEKEKFKEGLRQRWSGKGGDEQNPESQQ
ncbi:MAG: hypothetical protein ACT4OJ_16090 [Bacteroidota bacterium]